MDLTPLPDLDALDREALLDLIRQQASLTAAYDEEIRRLVEAQLAGVSGTGAHRD